MSATSSASLSTASAATTPGAGSTPGKEAAKKKRVEPSDVTRSFLACGLCGDLYEEPKLLPCFHSFCRVCLSGYIPHHSLSLACPTCRQHSILPVAGVPALRDNHLLLRLLARMDRLRSGRRRLENGEAAEVATSMATGSDVKNGKSREDEEGGDDEDDDGRDDLTQSFQDKSAMEASATTTADDFSTELDNSSEVFDDQSSRTDVEGSANDTTTTNDNGCCSAAETPPISGFLARCLRHVTSDLSHFCIECDTAICRECLEAEHRKHPVQDVEEFSAGERCSLEKILNSARDSCKSVDTSLRNIAKTKLKLERQRFEAEDYVERTFFSLRDALERKREALLAEIESESDVKSKKLDDQEREVTRLKRTIEACCSFVQSCLEGDDGLFGLVLARKELAEKLESFSRSNVQLLPEENPFVSFDRGKLSLLAGLIEESAKQSKNPTPVRMTPPMVVKKPKPSREAVRRPGKAERPAKSRKVQAAKPAKVGTKAGDSADSEASSESSGGPCLSVGPRDFGSVVCNSAVPYETTASGEHLRRCFVDVPALITVTTKDSKGLTVARGGAKLTAKIYALEVGCKGDRSSDVARKTPASDDCEVEATATKDQKVSFDRNCLREESIPVRSAVELKNNEDIVTVSRAEEAKERSVFKRTLVVPEILDLSDGTYELTFTVTENSLKRYPLGNHSSLDVSKTTTTTTTMDSGRLTPQSPISTRQELHSSLDKLQQKRRPKSAPESTDLLDSLQLEVKLYGQQIKGSPFSLKVRKEVPKLARDQKTLSRHSDGYNRRHSGSTPAKRSLPSAVKPFASGGNRKPSSASASQNDGPCQRIGAKGHNRGEFMNLQGIAVHGDRIYVADSNGQCVQVFSLDGKCVLKFGVKGRSPGQLQRPTGVTCSQDGQHILVSDYENKWVGVYNAEGRFLNRLGQGKLAGPKGVAIDKQGRVVIVDNKSSTVWLYTMSGKILGRFGARGVCASSGSSTPSASSPLPGFVTTGEAQARLAGPHFCSIDPEDGDVVVTDFHNHRVKVFSADGQYKFSFGSAGDGNGQFNAPTGVCVDRQGNILVADWGNSRIQIFDKNGSFLSHIDTSSDPLYGPQGLAISADNSVIVADSGNHCLKVYKHLFA